MLSYTYPKKGDNTMYICNEHNLIERNYHKKIVESYCDKTATNVIKYVWVDKKNGRYHIESSIEDIFSIEDSLMMWWYINPNVREKMPYDRQRTEKLHDMPEEYNAVVRIKLEPYKANKKLDKTMQKVRLERNLLQNTAFGIIEKPSLIASVMPCSWQRSTLEITDWVQYVAFPVGNTIALIYPTYLSAQSYVA